MLPRSLNILLFYPISAVKLTERIELKKTQQISRLCHLAKNLYNLATFYMRQDFFYLDNWLKYHDLWHILKDTEAFRRLPSQSAQQVLKAVDRAWKSFFNSYKDWKCRPEKYFGRPNLPRYKKKNGEFVVIFTNQQCRIKNGSLHFPKKSGLAAIQTRINSGLHQARIVPKGLYYMLEIIYEKERTDLKLNKDRIIGIDLGLNNIVTIVNNAGLKPAIIKGGIVKSINQYYNKHLAKYISIKDKQGLKFETKHLQRLTRHRNNKINDFFHKSSRCIIKYCIEQKFGTIIIGFNKTWKQKVRLGKVNNQNFVQIPFQKLIQDIRYKAELVGIVVRLEPELFTSKCSFLDNEPIQRHERYMGRRISRGLFKTKNGLIINSDVNGAYNIIRKAVPNAIVADGIEGVGFHPYSIAIS